MTDPLGTAARTPVDTAPETHFGVAVEQLAGVVGLALVARLVKYSGLAEGLARLVCVKRRRRAPYTQHIRPGSRPWSLGT